MNFVGRNIELTLLNELYQREGAQFLIVYGRRRIGKTRLLTQWLSQLGHPHIYWMATQTSSVNQLRNFSQTIFQFLNPEASVEPGFSYTSWDATFAEVSRVAAERRLVVVLDEFTYVMQADPELPSLIQRAWDHILKSSDVVLILMGSLAGIIQRAALDYHSPLYGRATARLKLRPLSFGALADMLPDFSAEQRVAAYTITGGIPAYIELFSSKINILQNLQQRIITPTNVMLGDAVFLLHEQVDDPRNYMAVLEAIGAGYHSLSDIAQFAGISRTNITKYLQVLQQLGYIERRVPATIRRPEKSRKGRYVIIDPYLRFYFRFLAPNLTAIEQGRIQQVTSLLYDHLLDFIGTHTFEELCRDWIGDTAEMGQFPFLPERIGSFWSPQAQVDVVAINWRTKNIALGECKWGRKPVGHEVIQDLLAKTDKVLPGDIKWHVHYFIFARNDFTPEAHTLATQHHVQLITLSQVETDMRRRLSDS